MTKKRILLINQEIAPYIPANPLSTLGKEIATSLQEHNGEVRIFMPKFGAVNERRNQLHEVIRLSGMNIPISDNDHPLIIKVASLQPSRIQVYFIDSDDYFQKNDSDIDAAGSNRPDNDERAIFFTRGTLETAKKLKWNPSIINCSGWISALMPIYLKKIYADDPSFKDSKIVYTIQPGTTPDSIDEKFFDKLKEDGIPQKDLKDYSSLPLNVNLLHKMAIDFSDAVVVADSDVDLELLKYVEDSGKPFITADKLQSGAGAYTEFFQSL